MNMERIRRGCSLSLLMFNKQRERGGVHEIK